MPVTKYKSIAEQPAQRHDALVDARVVLHRARAERVHAEVDRVIPG